MGAPLCVLVDFLLGRVPIGRRILLLVLLSQYIYLPIFYYTTISYGTLYPGVTFENWYSVFVCFLGQVFITFHILQCLHDYQDSECRMCQNNFLLINIKRFCFLAINRR